MDYEECSIWKKVFIHCRGGLGRSGTVVVAYLVYRYRLEWEDALKEVRNKRKNAVESIEQLSMLKAYSIFISSINKDKLDTIVKLVEKYMSGCGPWDINHASKVTQLSLRLWEGIVKQLGMFHNRPHLLGVASLLHDIGRCFKNEGEKQSILGAKLIKSSLTLKKLLSKEEINTISCLIKHHSRNMEPIRDPYCNMDKETIILTGILKIADAMDYTLDQRVLDAEANMVGNIIHIEITCEKNCRYIYPIVFEKVHCSNKS